MLLADYLYSSIVVFKSHPRLRFCVSRQTMFLCSLQASVLCITQLTLDCPGVSLRFTPGCCSGIHFGSSQTKRRSEYLSRLRFCVRHTGRRSSEYHSGLLFWVQFTPGFCSDVSPRISVQYVTFRVFHVIPIYLPSVFITLICQPSARWLFTLSSHLCAWLLDTPFLARAGLLSVSWIFWRTCCGLWATTNSPLFISVG